MPAPLPPPPCFIHVDLDGLWTLAGAYGYPEGDSFARDPVFEFALPRLLDLFARLEIQATFFIVGRDLELSEKRHAVRRILRRGHDLANHSYSHPIGLERLPYPEILDEIAKTQRALADFLAESGPGFAERPPVGFRAPGYDAGPNVLRACREVGLAYDGSLLPTPWAPALRFAANRLRSKLLSEASPSARAEFFARLAGQYGDGKFNSRMLAPQPFPGSPGAPPLLRLPLAVSPTLGLPLHASLGSILGERRVASGLRRLASRGWPITYLLHGLDAADPAEYIDFLPPALRRSRALNRPLADRMRFLETVLASLRSITQIMPTADYLADR